MKGKGKKIIEKQKEDIYNVFVHCLFHTYLKEYWRLKIKAFTPKFLSDHVMETLASNLEILVKAVQDHMQKQFDVGISMMKALAYCILLLDESLLHGLPKQKCV
ncbi:hypothetical protein Tco_0672692 [Tanacetum coccineum]